MTSDCSNLILDSQGCMTIARLMLGVIDIKAEKRLNEPGTCEACKRSLKFSWSLVNRQTYKEFDCETGSVEAGKCERLEFDQSKFNATPIYLCDRVLDRWATLEDAEELQLMTTYQGKHRQLVKRFLDTRSKVSPLDVAYALQKKREFDATQAFVPLVGEKTAPMDSLGR